MLERVKTAVLLVGGEGTRLRPYTNNLPKPLVEVAGRAILEWNTDWLKSHGVENLVFGCGQKKDQIEQFMRERNNLGFKSVRYSENTAAGGTAEAFRKAIEQHVSDDHYIAMNGDELTNLDLQEMINHHSKTGAVVTMAVVPFKAPYSVLDINRSTGMASSFTYGKKLRDVPISIGIYVFSKEVNALIPHEGAIEHTVFTQLAKDGKVAPYMLYTGEEWATVNDHKQRLEAEEALSRWGLVKKKE